MITVRYFAVVRERVRLSEELLPAAPGLTAGGVWAEVERRHPEIAALRAAIKLAVNQELVGDEHPVADGDEVALIPPVSGGSGLYRVTEHALSLDEVVRAVSAEGPLTGPSAPPSFGGAPGGIATFTGVVRRESRGKRIVRLEYEAYREMAERKMAEIGRGIEREWPGVRVAIVHRVGVLTVGEAAVVIAASAPHRAQAFEACRAAIDRLKESVPIWKKEIAEDGEEWIGLGP